LLFGVCDEIDMQLRGLELSPHADLEPVGILDSRGEHLGLSIRGVPVLGTIEALEQAVKRLQARNRRPECLVVVGPSDPVGGASWAQLVAHAESLRLEIERLPRPTPIDAAHERREVRRRGDLSALLGRPQASLDFSKVAEAIEGRRVLITGAGGTIGRELARQIAAVGPDSLLLVDHGEFNLYSVDMELRESHPDVRYTPLLCSVRERKRVMQLFAEHAPELVFHAAALKHVPLVEVNPCAGVLTNVLGTRNVADAARRYGVRAMIQVSTDKAVNPVGVMGATKRLAELYCQALDLETAGRPGAPRFMTVRFGNVLGSSGSLIPLFQSQLSRGGPLTVTHPEITRYFMTVHEAVQLVLRSSVEALTGERSRGRVLVLDMGEPIKVIDIARRMIRLAGLRPEIDIPIQIIGLRPGEKLFEELFDSTERRLNSTLPGIFEAEPNPVPLDLLNRAFDQLAVASASGDPDAIGHTIKAILPDYRPSGEPERIQAVAAQSPRRAVASALHAT
jgi:O-antigen biosynthesis protein WbqV